jgi:hypothetical protein
MKIPFRIIGDVGKANARNEQGREMNTKKSPVTPFIGLFNSGPETSSKCNFLNV